MGYMLEFICPVHELLSQKINLCLILLYNVIFDDLIETTLFHKISICVSFDIFLKLGQLI